MQTHLTRVRVKIYEHVISPGGEFVECGSQGQSRNFNDGEEEEIEETIAGKLISRELKRKVNHPVHKPKIS